MKNLNFTPTEILQREQMKTVFGGESCTANCGGGHVVTCTGNDTCVANDGSGCSSDLETKSCPPPP